MPFVLSAEDHTILTVLSSAGHALLFADIVSATAALIHDLRPEAARKAGIVALNEKTVGERVPVLETHGMLCKPLGADGKPTTRKGVGITDAGRARLANKS
jgi:hypothetical protein